MTTAPAQFTAFQGDHRLLSGPPAEVAVSVRNALARLPERTILVFDDATGRQVDLDPRGMEEVEPPARGPGRPKLGVVAREVTLLPRHWDWLNAQPGGASVVLRRLVDAARVATAASDRVRLAREAADRFMAVMAGDRPGYEEGSRALYAGDRMRFEAEIANWPADIRDHARWLAQDGLGGQG